MKKKDKLSDIKLNESGLKYEYQGKYMVWRGSGENDGFGAFRGGLLLRLLVPVAFLAALGCIPGSVMDGAPILLIPYAIAIVLYALMLYKTVRFLMAGKSIRQYVFDETLGRMSIYARYCALVSGFGFCGFLMLIFTEGVTGDFFHIAVYPAVMAISLAGGWLMKTYGEESTERFRVSDEP